MTDEVLSDTELTARLRKFNYKLSHARVVAENAFSQLKIIWCSLMKRNVNNIKYVPRSVYSILCIAQFLRAAWRYL